MPIATMTSKGQITVPKEVREALGLEAGDQVMFVRNPANGSYRLLARNGTWDDLDGLLYRPEQRALTIDEINEGIAAGAIEGAMGGVPGWAPPGSAADGAA